MNRLILIKKKMDDHSRTIVHIDIDCFYAQVEMNKQPTLKNQPLGIRQKNIVVTSNYIARAYGIKKCMSVSDSTKLCPNLVLVNGEDLYEYRQVSNKVSELLKVYSELVERLGLDENFVDISHLVEKKMLLPNLNTVVGCTFGDTNTMSCECGCQERLAVGSHIAQQIRDDISETLQLTTCAGIAHNKLLAKIVGSKNKPNKQTTLFPNSAPELILSLESVKNIPWIGQATSELLSKVNINKVEDLQNCDIKRIEQVVDVEKARHLVDLSYGIDHSVVKVSGRPQSFGLEDAGKPLTSEKDIEAKFKQLLTRLLILVNEDGRVPKLMKITVRKFSKSSPIRETRQCAIDIPLNKEDRLLQAAMSLFRKVVEKESKFKVTCLGLSFGKLVEKPVPNNTLNAFLARAGKSSGDSPPGKRLRLSMDEYASSEPGEAINCPPDVDKDVFKELPLEVQEELWNDYKNRRAREKKQEKLKTKAINKSNSILNYMMRQPKT